ncbi:PREDICTED: 39S ribosomal protein L42, mitochondrial [Nanorana parkeri]|uniref:39S ribosomal protein L42, mitochondrial n=1 Tax=Nanorana parkeri TaxID=125878 RepID=UPI000854AFC0|nr:PREDICTED: 39S ribosomal protein L42, mitochondrial [Nanorana parkeri]
MAATVLKGCREVFCGLRAVRCSLLGTLGRGSAGQGGDHSLHCGKSTYSALPDDYNCKVELAMTSDGKTIVCYHPSVDIPYEHTKPLPRRDPVENHEESHDQVLKARLIDITSKREPTMEELSKMFYTTKHRWYPVGQYRRRQMKKEHPKDR